jgi:hypothetical protein
MEYQKLAIETVRNFCHENPTLKEEAMDFYLLFQAEIVDEESSMSHEFELLEVSLEQLKEDRL